MAIMSIMSSCNSASCFGCIKFQCFASNFLGKTERVAVVGGGEVVDNGTSLKSKTHVNKIDRRDEMQKLTKRNECSLINETLVMGGGGVRAKTR